jgi:hypothetical protein
MTRASFRLLVALALLPCCARESTPEPVYRYINVLGGTKIHLGEPFVRTDISAQLDDTTYSLRPGTFAGGGTVSIVARTDRRGLLRSMAFVYDGSESLAVKVQNYTTHLGPPAQHQTSKDGASLYVWQDDSTRFVLHYEPQNSPVFWSLLSDRVGS